MQILIVVNDPDDWPLRVPGVEVVAARSYLADPRYSQLRRARLINLCRSYRYQSVGYYVSLLAEARGHKPQPSVATIQDMKSQTLARLYSEELDELLQQSLLPIRSKQFTLSIYFGRNVAKRYERLSMQLFNLFPAPLLRAHCVRDDNEWRLQRIAPIPVSDIPPQHREFATAAAAEYFNGHRRRIRRQEQMRYDLAILHNPEDKTPPSDKRALERFVKAARELSIEAELIDKGDFGRLAEFDALFIRETTAVNHHTYRFSRRAAAEGLAVIDDPDSILKCTNKVYLAQLLERHRVGAPKTMIVHRDNIDSIAPSLGLPCVLKQPDGSSSLGVLKVDTERRLQRTVEELLDRSDMIVAQEFLPTEFDWRVGILDGQMLWVCKYHMAKDHWQIIKRNGKGDANYGRVECIPVEAAPRDVVETSLKAASLIGDGLYGVDLKQVRGRNYVIEVNDNPNIDAGLEDAILKEQLYLRIMESFVRRIEHRNSRRETVERPKVASL